MDRPPGPGPELCVPNHARFPRVHGRRRTGPGHRHRRHRRGLRVVQSDRPAPAAGDRSAQSSQIPEAGSQAVLVGRAVPCGCVLSGEHADSLRGSRPHHRPPPRRGRRVRVADVLCHRKLLHRTRGPSRCRSTLHGGGRSSGRGADGGPRARLLDEPLRRKSRRGGDVDTGKREDGDRGGCRGAGIQRFWF